MLTSRFIILTKDFDPIKNVFDQRSYMTASFATSSCNWNDRIYCDVTVPDNKHELSVHKWMSDTGSGCHFISVI